MAYNLTALFGSRQIASRDSLVKAVAQRGLLLELSPVASIEDLSGYCVVRKGGEISGFEVVAKRIDIDEVEDHREDLELSGKDPEKDPYLQALLSCDYWITVSCKNDLEMGMGYRFMEILNQIGAFIFDPQSSRFVGPDGKELEVS